MSATPSAPSPDRAPLLLALGAALVALVSAHTEATSANDISRIATVECLVDQGTFAIDKATIPPDIDRVLIEGQFYSDKPPAQQVLMSGVYWILQKTFGLRASQQPALFYYLMTLASCGLAYLLSIVFCYQLGRGVGLSQGWSVALSMSLGLSTLALPYLRDINPHLVLLAPALYLFGRLAQQASRPDPPQAISCAILGLVGGFGYGVEQVCGGLLLGGAGLYLVLRWRRWSLLLPYLIGALPWILLHHGILYSIAGSLKPLGAYPEYFDYPGSAFDAETLTGKWNHPSLAAFVGYAFELLFSWRGIFPACLPILLVFPALYLFWREREIDLLILLACGWIVGSWLIYAALSTNFSGVCCSCRWLVPLLAGFYYLLALLLQNHPSFRRDFVILSGWGAVLGGLMWWGGAWASEVPFFWCVHSAALATWVALTRSVPGWPWARQLRDRYMLRAGPALTLLALTAVLPYLLESRPALPIVSSGHINHQNGAVLILLVLGLIVGLRARADGEEMPWGAGRTLTFALLAAVMTLLHWLMVDSQPVRAAWQKELYYDILSGKADAPHQLRPLPYGLVRLFERLTGNWLFSCLSYRWFFTFWVLWCAERFARLFLSPGRAALSVLPLVLLYPLSIAHYWGQLTDPFSHLLIVFSLICIVQNRLLALGASLGLGIWAKETSILVAPVYLACNWRRWRAWLVTGCLGLIGIAAFVAARGVAWRPSFDTINGTSGLMIGTNLGLGKPIATTAISLLENYLHPLLFVGIFIPGILLSWRQADPRLKAIFLSFTPLLLASNLCFGWLYESRNYIPLIPVLATLALVPTGKKGTTPREGTATGQGETQ